MTAILESRGCIDLFKAHINGNKIQTCQEHSINTARYAKNYAGEVGIKNTAYLCGLLHDVGKCTEEFNNYIEAAVRGEDVNKGSVIHTFAGVVMVLSEYHSHYNPDAENSPYKNLTAELIAGAIGSHHGQFDIYNADGKSGFEHRFEKQPEYDRKAIQNYYKECVSKDKIDDLFRESEKEIENFYGRLFELLEKTEDEDKCEEMLFYLGCLERMLLSLLIEGDRRDTAEFMSDGKMDFPDLNENIQEIWKDTFNHLMWELNKFPQETEMQCARRELSDYCEAFAEKPCSIYRLNLPTGAGKTLSSLRYGLAHARKFNKKHIIFAVPLLSILDQNADVIREAVGNDEVILEHHSNVIQEGLSEKEILRREILIDTWDSPIIITTLVQLLNTMFDGKTSSIRRFHSLIDSVVIIDEVQSVPTKILSLFNLTLNFLSKVCNTTFLLCSATQPLLEKNNHKLLVDKSEVIPTDKLEKYKKIFKRTNVQYIGEMNQDEIIQKVKEYFQNYNSVLVVCNTKREAYELFSKAKSVTDNSIHLSTAMCMAHRKEVIEKMSQKLKDKEPLICISTQLIEAGVDVSFGSVIRLAAGIDNVAQAAGRGNRNGESESLSPVGIAFLKGENLSRLKEIKLAQDVTGELVTEYLKRPEIFENDLISDTAVNYYYERLIKKIEKVRHWTDYSVEDSNLLDYLSCNAYNTQNISDRDKDITMRQAFKTAGEKFEVFDNTQTTVIVSYGKGKEIINEILSDRFKIDISWAKQILKESKEYTVSLYEYQIKKLNECGALFTDNDKTVLILNPDYYDSQVGVMTEKGDDSEWSTLIL